MLTGSLSPSSAGRLVAAALPAGFFGGNSVLRTFPFAIILRGFERHVDRFGQQRQRVVA